MMILALESSAKPASAAIYSDGELIGQYFQNSGLTHSRTLLAMTDALMKNLDISASELDVIAVSRGPGSFTGVRIGVSAAKGIAWGLDKPVCGVSTLEAMACQTPVEGALICPVMDARRGQVYNAVFERRKTALVRLCEDRAISLRDLAADLRSYFSTQGTLSQIELKEPAFHAKAPSGGSKPVFDPPVPDIEPNATVPESSAAVPPDPNHVFRVADFQVCLVGDGALLGYKYLSDAGIDCFPAPGLLRYQSAFGVALAAATAIPIPAGELEPCYLRPSQAERERRKAAADQSARE